MVRVTIDMATMAKLHNLDSYLEFCDESGKLVGHFLPATDRSIYEGVDSPTPPEEIDRRLREESERPLKDILHDLEKRH